MNVVSVSKLYATCNVSTPWYLNQKPTFAKIDITTTTQQHRVDTTSTLSVTLYEKDGKELKILYKQDVNVSSGDIRIADIRSVFDMTLHDIYTFILCKQKRGYILFRIEQDAVTIINSNRCSCSSDDVDQVLGCIVNGPDILCICSFSEKRILRNVHTKLLISSDNVQINYLLTSDKTGTNVNVYRIFKNRLKRLIVDLHIDSLPLSGMVSASHGLLFLIDDCSNIISINLKSNTIFSKSSFSNKDMFKLHVLSNVVIVHSVTNLFIMHMDSHDKQMTLKSLFPNSQCCTKRKQHMYFLLEHNDYIIRICDDNKICYEVNIKPKNNIDNYIESDGMNMNIGIVKGSMSPLDVLNSLRERENEEINGLCELLRRNEEKIYMIKYLSLRISDILQQHTTTPTHGPFTHEKLKHTITTKRHTKNQQQQQVDDDINICKDESNEKIVTVIKNDTCRDISGKFLLVNVSVKFINEQEEDFLSMYLSLCVRDVKACSWRSVIISKFENDNINILNLHAAIPISDLFNMIDNSNNNVPFIDLYLILNNGKSQYLGQIPTNSFKFDLTSTPNIQKKHKQNAYESKSFFIIDGSGSLNINSPYVKKVFDTFTYNNNRHRMCFTLSTYDSIHSKCLISQLSHNSSMFVIPSLCYHSIIRLQTSMKLIDSEIDGIQRIAMSVNSVGMVKDDIVGILTAQTNSDELNGWLEEMKLDMSS